MLYSKIQTNFNRRVQWGCTNFFKQANLIKEIKIRVWVWLWLSDML